jgi:carbon starvation protein CstA
VPVSFVATTTLTAGWLSITDNFLPLARAATTPAGRFQGYLNAGLTAAMMALILITIANCVVSWLRAASSGPPRFDLDPEGRAV